MFTVATTLKYSQEQSMGETVYELGRLLIDKTGITGWFMSVNQENGIDFHLLEAGPSIGEKLTPEIISAMNAGRVDKTQIKSAGPANPASVKASDLQSFASLMCSVLCGQFGEENRFKKLFFTRTLRKDKLKLLKWEKINAALSEDSFDDHPMSSLAMKGRKWIEKYHEIESAMQVRVIKAWKEKLLDEGEFPERLYPFESDVYEALPRECKRVENGTRSFSVKFKFTPHFNSAVRTEKSLHLDSGSGFDDDFSAAFSSMQLGAGASAHSLGFNHSRKEDPLEKIRYGLLSCIFSVWSECIKVEFQRSVTSYERNGFSEIAGVTFKLDNIISDEVDYKQARQAFADALDLVGLADCIDVVSFAAENIPLVLRCDPVIRVKGEGQYEVDPRYISYLSRNQEHRALALTGKIINVDVRVAHFPSEAAANECLSFSVRSALERVQILGEGNVYQYIARCVHGSLEDDALFLQAAIEHRIKFNVTRVNGGFTASVAIAALESEHVAALNS